jgi:hypothetical protein
MNPVEVTWAVKKRELETLTKAGPSAMSTTDFPIRDEVRKTVGTLFARYLRRTAQAS